MSHATQESRSLILAGPPSANLMGTAYPVLRQYRVPVRLVAADPTALAMVVEANPTDRLFLMPDLFTSVEAAGSFLDSLPDSTAVLVGLPRDWSSNLCAVESHPHIEMVYRQPFDWHQIARTLMDDQHSKGAAPTSNSEEISEKSQPQAPEGVSAGDHSVGIPRSDGLDGKSTRQASTSRRRL